MLREGLDVYRTGPSERLRRLRAGVLGKSYRCNRAVLATVPRGQFRDTQIIGLNSRPSVYKNRCFAETRRVGARL